MSAYLGTHW